MLTIFWTVRVSIHAGVTATTHSHGSVTKSRLTRTYLGRYEMRCRLFLAAMGSLLATAPMAKAQQIGALLTGYERGACGIHYRQWGVHGHGLPGREYHHLCGDV